jgi:hypothetical protein
VNSINNLFVNANNYFFETSYQQTSLTGTVFNWSTLPVNSNDECDTVTNTMNQVSEGSLRLGSLDLSAYNRIVFIFPKASDCSFSGLGVVGGARTTSWINGNIKPWVITHEMGHNFGIWHSRLYQCDGPNPLAQGCKIQEYGNPADSMGNTYQGHFNAYQKESLGWLGTNSTPQIQLVNSTGNFTIEPFETLTRGVKALKILKANLPDGSKDYFYVEYRQPIGFDEGLSRLPKNNLIQGILIHVGNDQNANSNLLLDMNPKTSTGLDAALKPGATLSDAGAPEGGVVITLNSVDSKAASISIRFGTQDTGVSGNSATSLLQDAQTTWTLVLFVTIATQL